MDEGGCGSGIIRLSWSVTDITLSCNGVKWWIIDILL